MFAIPGFNVGNLVVEAPKEQLKKRKHDAVSSVTSISSTSFTKTAETTTTATTTSTTTTSTTNKDTSASSVLPIALSTSNAPFSKKFKKEPVYEKRPPSEPKLGWGWIPEPVPLKERASWNRSTKELRKAKAQEEEEKKRAKLNAISGPAAAAELLLQGEVDLKDIAGLEGKGKKKNSSISGKDKGGDIIMADAIESQHQGEQAVLKKRNKRLERKIKKAAYIAAIESSKSAAVVDQETSAEESREKAVEDNGESGDADVAEPENSVDSEKKMKKEKVLQKKKEIHPELAKLTNKERRLLKQFQKRQEQEGIDLTTKAVPELLHGEKKGKAAATPAAATPVVAKGTNKKDKTASNASRKQQQLAQEREKLLEALNRTNSALAELQSSLGNGDEDETLMDEADIKSTVQNKKNKKEKETTTTSAAKKEKTAPTLAATLAPAPALASVPVAKQPKLTKLQEQMKKTLAGGKFRFLNEQLYTTTGEEAFDLFQSKPELFDEYHEGFRSQVEAWPQNPVDIFIAQLRQMPKDTVIADLGCGDAQIAKELTKHKVLSFDLVAKNERVTACDIAHLPLEDASVDVAIFCLSLMGTDFLKFLKEAFRVLKPNGQLKISEVISRFTDVDAFVAALKSLGFELKHSDSSNKMFIMFDFIKPDPNVPSSKKSKKGSKKQKVQEDSPVEEINPSEGPSLLKPCIYKKR